VKLNEAPFLSSAKCIPMATSETFTSRVRSSTARIAEVWASAVTQLTLSVAAPRSYLEDYTVAGLTTADHRTVELSDTFVRRYASSRVCGSAKWATGQECGYENIVRAQSLCFTASRSAREGELKTNQVNRHDASCRLSLILAFAC